MKINGKDLTKEFGKDSCKNASIHFKIVSITFYHYKYLFLGFYHSDLLGDLNLGNT